MIKNIIFDMGRVLIYYDPAFAAENIFPGNTNAAEIAKTITGSHEWHLLDMGKVSEPEAIRSMCERYPEFSSEIPVYMDKWQEWIRPIPKMYELILSLKERGYNVHLLSNASMRFFDYTRLYTVFSLFDSINVSAQMKKVKPNHDIYEMMLERNNLVASECLFIDDMPENIKAAEELGIRARLFTTPDDLIEFLKSEKII